MPTSTIVCIDDVHIGRRRRSIDQNVVDKLSQSIESIGLINAIKVFAEDNGNVFLVSGLHRIEAFRKLGRNQIDCLYVTGDEIARELMEISENLHRAKLTVQERSEQIARWARLTRIKLAQNAPVSSKGGRGKRGGARTVAAELGFSRDQVDRSEKIAALTSEAKKAAKELGIDDNQSALLAASNMPPHEQEAEIRRQAAMRLNASDLSEGVETRLQLIDAFRQKLRKLLDSRPCDECLDIVEEAIRSIRIENTA